MKNMKIVSNNSITKDVFLDGVEIHPLDFGSIIKSKILSKDENISSVIFERKLEPESHVLNKYKITKEEFFSISKNLERELQSYLF